VSGDGGRRRAGFTLIELLLVIIILAAIAGAAVATLETATGDASVRGEDTRNRLERIRTAILGPDGATTPQGFVADVGRLPYLESPGIGQVSGLIELVENRNDVPTWRGPYVRTLPGPGGLEFPDGWGNSIATGATGADANSFGWHVERFDDQAEADAYNTGPHGPEVTTAPVASGDLLVQSYGIDHQPNGTAAFAVDYPALPLIRVDDYLVPIAGKQLRVTVHVADNDVAGIVHSCRLHFGGPAGEAWTAYGDPTPGAPLALGANSLTFVFHDVETDALNRYVERIPIGRLRLEVLFTSASASSRAFQTELDVIARSPLRDVHASRVVEVGP